MGKTQLLKDARTKYGIALKSRHEGFFRKVTRVTNKSLYMGHLELKFPKDPKLIVYDGELLKLLSPEGSIVSIYRCKHLSYWN